MPIIKKSVVNRVTILTNELLQNPTMSLAAKGLLGYLLSLPSNWDFTIKGIAKNTGTSEYKITELLKELESNGYHTKRHIYENGKIKDWIYYIFAEPRQDIIEGTFDAQAFEQELQNQDEQELQNQVLENDSLNKCISNKLDIQNNNKKINSIYTREELELKENIKCIIDYLNESIGSNYRYTTKGTISLIKARFNDGYTLDDFYDVIDNKVKEWINDSEMCKYLRPETLFGNKFESYLNGKVFSGKPKTSYGSKPNFDNTANENHNTKIYHISDEEFDKLTHQEKINTLLNDFGAVADMTKKQYEFYNQYCLARDENGNLLEF